MGTIPQNLTPMMRQYLDIKKGHQDAILFFRMGDFYEMFFDDALKASPILEIALTSRNKGEENAIPFCGIPHHAAASYIARLVQAGLKVAVCEQVEDPQAAKGIVKREVVRVITPGLVLESESLDAKGNNYLAALALNPQQFGLALADVSTGEMEVAFFYDEEDLLSELNRRDPKELLLSPSEQTHPLIARLRRHFPQCLIHFQEVGSSADELLSFFPEAFRDSWREAGLQSLAPITERAALRLLDYVRSTLKTQVNHLSDLKWSAEGSHLVLDAATVRNLELLRNLQDGMVRGSLFQVLDRTQTPMGARRLKTWILYPLAQEAEIKKRQQAIAEFMEKPEVLRGLRDLLSFVIDLERQNGRMATGIAHARDLWTLGSSLQRLPQLREELKKLDSLFFKNLLHQWSDLKELADKIVATVRDDAPLALKEGGLIRSGVSSELDELKAIRQDGKTVLARMEDEERRKTSIPSLKVRYNQVFGYYIEIPHTRRDSVPAHYIRKQTLVNAERYITPELKTYEDKVLGAEEKIHRLEYEMFIRLREEVALEAVAITRMARKLSDLDALGSLAVAAQENNYCLPLFTDGRELVIEEGRHPVLEKLFPSQRFVPNDLNLNDADGRLIILTGPNMAGKSTVLRQTALIALMAHMGSFVPAKGVRLGLIDRIFTRIGASDNLSKNQSTFWVEMEETARILNSATRKSLVILDEIGRGTSTYDGLAVAWAVAEDLHDRIGAKTLFATHYHELIALEGVKEGVKNFHIAVKEWNGEILFLYRMVPGGIHRSYGVQVASLAGIPPPVIGRAKEILNDLQNSQKNGGKGEDGPKAVPQMSLFSPPGGGPPSGDGPPPPPGPDPLLVSIKEMDLNRLSPFEALQFLYDLQKKI